MSGKKYREIKRVYTAVFTGVMALVLCVAAFFLGRSAAPREDTVSAVKETMGAFQESNAQTEAALSETAGTESTAAESASAQTETQAVETQAPETQHPETTCPETTAYEYVSHSAELSYWTEGSPVAASIIEYVNAACDPDSPAYIPPEDRIAVFDMDGTFYSETLPMYVDACLFVYHVLEDGTYTADDDMKAFAMTVRNAMNEKKSALFSYLEVAERSAKCYSDLTVADFKDLVRRFAAGKAEGIEGVTYASAFYRPMVSLIRFLAANDFKVYIISGAERTTVRVLTESVIGDVVPPDRIIGSDYSFTASMQGDLNGRDYTYSKNDELMMGDRCIVKNINMNKVSAIEREIGKVPVLAFGNSTGDYAMAEYTLSNRSYEGRAYILVLDDNERERANMERAAALKQQCDERGFITISMKNDFALVF